MKARSQSSSTPIRRFKDSSRARAAERWSRASVLRELKRFANPQVRAKMAYFGVNVPKAHGISAPILHALAQRIGKDHALAEQLWSSGIHEARILAMLIGEPDKVTAAQMERWARMFDAWDVVDGLLLPLCRSVPGMAASRGLEQAKRRVRQASGFFLIGLSKLQG